MAHFLVFDLGTSGGKSAVVDEQGVILASRKEKWVARDSPGLEFVGKEFSEDEVESKLILCAEAALKESRTSPEEVKAIATTALRFGCVFLDQDDRVLYLGSNMDGRGMFEQDVVESKFGDDIYEMTGLYPAMLSCVAKLLWFKDNAPEKYRKIAKVMNLNDWWTYKLSGTFCTDRSSASTTMFFDLKRGKWSDEVLAAFGLDSELLPQILDSGCRAGTLTDEYGSSLGLKDVDVVLGGPDTQCGLLGAGCLLEDETGIVAGATAPCQMISRDPAGGAKKQVLVGAYLLPGQFVIETNAGQCGVVYDWAVRTYVGDVEDAFARAERMLSETSAGPSGINSFIGSQIMILEKMHLLKPSVMTFPSPVMPPFFRTEASVFLRSALEEVAFAISHNLAILESFTKRSSPYARLTGGMVRSRTFRSILSNALAKPVRVSSEADGTMLGAALCAMVGSGTYTSLEDAAKGALHSGPTAKPDESVAGDFSEAKGKWKDLYLKILELVEDGKM